MRFASLGFHRSVQDPDRPGKSPIRFSNGFYLATCFSGSGGLGGAVP